MSVITNRVILGQAGNDNFNFMLDTDIAGALRLRRGSSGAGGTVLSVDSSGRVDLPGNTLVQANQTPLPTTVSTLLRFTHGLGFVPDNAKVELVCLTAEFGYSVGDVVDNATVNPTGSVLIIPIVTRTTTVVEARTGAVTGNFYITNKATGGHQTPTAANWAWRFKVRAK